MIKEKLGKEEIKTEIPKAEGVLTHEDLKREETVKAPSLKKKTVKEKKQDVGLKYECGFAPLGNAKIAFVYKHEGVERKYNLDLINKIYTIPKDLTEKELVILKKALKANDFKDITVLNSGIVFDKQKGKYIYKAVHPDYTDKNRINGTISLVLLADNGKPMADKDGKQIIKQVTILEGIVITEDEKVYTALLKAGFRSLGKKEVDENVD